MEPIVKGQVMGPAGELVAREMAFPLPLPEPPLPMPGIPPVEPGMPPVEPGMPPAEAGMPPVEAGMPPVEAGMPLTDPGMLGEDPAGVSVIDGMLPAPVGVPEELFMAGMSPPGWTEGSLLGIDGIDCVEPTDRDVD